MAVSNEQMNEMLVDELRKKGMVPPLTATEASARNFAANARVNQWIRAMQVQQMNPPIFSPMGAINEILGGGGGGGANVVGTPFSPNPLFGNEPGRWVIDEERETTDAYQYAPVVEEKPEDVVAEMLAVEDTMANNEYIELADKLGVVNSELWDTKFKRFLQREEIPVFPVDKVDNFLAWAARQEKKKLVAKSRDYLYYNMHVVWRPLRKSDQEPHAKMFHELHSVYSHAVPLTALKMVDRVCSAWPKPEELSFSVSDYEAVKPDPFLQVMGPSRTRYVICHWDEPNFVM